MSSGSSSQDVACFSVERTKYLMFWKSIPDRSEPQSGIGLRPNSLRALSRRSSIHSGSFLRREGFPAAALSRPRGGTGEGRGGGEGRFRGGPDYFKKKKI